MLINVLTAGQPASLSALNTGETVDITGQVYWDGEELTYQATAVTIME